MQLNIITLALLAAAVSAFPTGLASRDELHNVADSAFNGKVVSRDELHNVADAAFNGKVVSRDERKYPSPDGLPSASMLPETCTRLNREHRND